MTPLRHLAAAGLLVLAACRPTASPPSEGGSSRANAPETAGPRRGDFERELLLTGELEAVRSISIKAPQTALFQMRIQFMAEEGALVKAGDPLLTFDSSSLVAQVDDLKTRILDAETQIVAKRAEVASSQKDLQIALAEAEHAAAAAELEAAVEADVLPRRIWAERQLKRDKTRRELDETKHRAALAKERGQAEMDVLVIQRDKLQQDLRIAQDGLALLTITAPSDGIVVYERRQENQQRFQEGDSCWPGQGVVQLPDLSEMRATFLVHEVDAPLLTVGMPVSVVLDAFPGREIAAVIDHVPSMAVKKAEGSKINVFRVHGALAETWVGDMKPGMSVLGRVVVERIPAAPLLSRAAVRFDGTSWWWPASASPEDAVRIEPLARNATDFLLSEEDFTRLSGAAGNRS